MNNRIEMAENAFLSSGMERMNKYFGKTGKRPDGIPYQNVLWDTKGRYYCLVEDGRFITVKCGENLDGPMESILSFSAELSEDELSDIVKEARGCVLKKYLQVLKSYQITPLKEPKIYIIPDKYFESELDIVDRNDYGINVIYYEKKYEPSGINPINKTEDASDDVFEELNALFDQKEFSKALDRCKEIMASLDKGKSPNTSRYLCLEYIAYIYRIMGDYTNALFTDSEMCRSLLTDQAGSSPAYCSCLRSLVYDNYLLNDYTEAEKYGWGYLESVGLVYGGDSEEMLRAALFFEPVLFLNGRYKEAFKIVLSTYLKAKKLHGLTHEIALDALSRLPSYYLLVRAYDKAIEIDTFVYDVYMAVFGENDIRTLDALFLLSIDLGIVGKRSDAVAISEYCVTKTQFLFGFKSPEHLIAEYDCGMQYLAWNRWGKARAIFKNCLPAANALGIENRELKFKLLSGIASANLKSGRTEEAYKAYKSIHEDLSAILDEYDIRVIRALEKTSLPLRNSEPEKAIDILKQVYRKKCVTIGEDDDDTLGTLSNLSIIYSDIGNYEESLRLTLNCYKAFLSKYGSFHDGTMTSEDNLVICYKDLQRFEEAYRFAQTIYSKRKDLLGEDDPETARMKQFMDNLVEIMKKEPEGY